MRKPIRLALAQILLRNLPPLIAPRLRGYIYPFELARADDYPFTATSQTGTIFQGSTGDPHAYSFSVTGYYDWRNLAIAAAVCREGDTILEVGANVGTETVGFAGLAGPRGRIIAFEPVPSNVAALRSTLALNQKLNVTLFPNAVGEACSRVRFCVSDNRGESGLGHISTAGAAKCPDQIEVECLTLDSVSDRLGAARLLAIDVEGFEMSVLRGGESFIRRHRPVIILEAVDAHQRRAGYTTRELHATLAQFGYKVKTIGTLGLRPVEISESANWLSVHESQPDIFGHVTNVIRRAAFLPCVAGLNPISRRSRGYAA